MICTFFFSFLHIFVKPSFGDDIAYTTAINRVPFIPWIVERYWNWSSRLFIDEVTYYVAGMPLFVWTCLDILIMTILYRNLHKICFKRKDTNESYILLMLLLCYPYAHLGTAGWIATTINYSWPIAIFLFPVYGMVRQYRDEQVKWWEYVGYMVCIFFACSNEQMAMISFLCFIIGWAFFKNAGKRYSKLYMILAVIVSFWHIVFIFTCPGNISRMLIEAENFMPEFYDLPFLYKILLNYIAVFEHFVSRPSALYGILCLLLCMGVWKNTEKIWKRVVGCFPYDNRCILYHLLFCVRQYVFHTKPGEYITPDIVWETRGEATEE